MNENALIVTIDIAMMILQVIIIQCFEILAMGTSKNIVSNAHHPIYY